MSFEKAMSPPFSRTTSGDALADRRYAYGAAALEEGDYGAARDLFTQMLELTPLWPPGWLALGKAHLALGEQGEARAAFRQVIALDAADILGAGLYLAQLGEDVPLSAAMQPAYVAALFDDYAPRFDAHLTGKLTYRAPDLLAEALEAVAAGRTFPAALDLGCGTGLMARALAGRYDAMTGIDLSPAMLREAEKTGLYTRLEAAEILAFLAGQGVHYNLILAADVFCYIADLTPVLVAMHKRLHPNGLAAFTVQTHERVGVVLGQDQRFHHALPFVERLAQEACFTPRLSRAITPRMDGGKPVAGAMLVLERP
jgi:predicted TPR repeat methyltransferase